MVIAIGTGVYAGLNSTSEWRKISYDQSYAALNAHDLRVILAEGSFEHEDNLGKALAAMEHPEWVSLWEERLLLPTQVEVSTDRDTLLVPGRLVGVRTADGGPQVDSIYLVSGKGLSQSSGAVLEAHFAREYHLPSSGLVKLAGGVPIEYSGTGFTPEYFMVTSGQGDFYAQANFAVLFLPLEVAQEIGRLPGRVNDMIVKLAPGIDRQAAAVEVEKALARELPNLGVEVKTIEDDPAYHLLYRDLDSDKGTSVAMALLVLLGAAFAAFNLTSRVVEAGRREIGIAMALGVPRQTIALRPLVMGGEIAILGVALGIGMGFLMGALMKTALSSLMPLPVWRTSFQTGPFLQGATIGFLLPFLASAWPVWRAVRVEPVQAIQPGHLASRGGGLVRLLKKLRVPGRSLSQMPWRNLFRAPRRTALTALGIGASIVVLVAVVGALDSFNGVLDRMSSEMGGERERRVTVTLADYQPQDSQLIRMIQALGPVSVAEPTLLLGARVSSDKGEMDLQLEALDLDSPIWHPTVKYSARPEDAPGIVLAEGAAAKLGVRPGDQLLLTYPFRLDENTFSLRQAPVRLLGVHPNPLIILAYIHISNAHLFGLAGYANQLKVVPQPGYSIEEIKRSMFGIPGVAVVQDPHAVIDMTRDMLRRFNSVFQIVGFFVFILTLLIAFSAANISTDERRRELATMEAFGVRVRTLVRMAVVESGAIGVLGTLLGLGFGFLALGWLLQKSAETTQSLQLISSVKPATIAITFLVGVGAAALAPLLQVRKMSKIDVPSTLRVME